MKSPAQYWNGSAWVSLGPQGPMGPPGGIGFSRVPGGSAGGDLTGTYPNPGINKLRVGGLLAVQRMFGENAAYNTIINGNFFTVDAAKAKRLQIQYTPSVDCWWEVELRIGIHRKTDAAYAAAFTFLTISPNDQDNAASTWWNENQNSTVQTYVFKHITRTFSLNAGVAYTAYGQFQQLATSGTWQFYQGPERLSITGAAWAQ